MTMRMHDTTDRWQRVRRGAYDFAAQAGEQLRDRAADVGSAAGDVARSTADKARSTAADGLARAGRAVEPPGRRGHRGPPRAVRFLLVPVIVAGVVWLVRNLRSRPTAGRQGDEQATDASGADIEARGAAPTGSPSSAADATDGSTGNGAEHAGSPGHQVG